MPSYRQLGVNTNQNLHFINNTIIIKTKVVFPQTYAYLAQFILFRTFVLLSKTLKSFGFPHSTFSMIPDEGYSWNASCTLIKICVQYLRFYYNHLDYIFYIPLDLGENCILRKGCNLIFLCDSLSLYLPMLIVLQLSFYFTSVSRNIVGI